MTEPKQAPEQDARKLGADLRVAQCLARARADHRDGKLSAALRAYEQVLAWSPEHPDALYLLGLLRYREEKSDDAIHLISRAIEQQPQHAMAHASLAQIYQDQQQHPRAVEHFSRALETTPDDANILHGLGLSLYKLGRLPEAEREFYRAIECQPGMAKAYNNLGNVQQSRGAYAAAMRSYQRCLSCDPGFVQAHNNLGVLYQTRGQFDAAIRLFEAALGLQPDYVEALNNLAAVQLHQAALPQALAGFKRAMQLQPGFSAAEVNAAMVLHQLGDHEQSRTILDRVLQRVPDDPGVHWVRAVAELESVYQSVDHIDASRRRYAERLRGVLIRLAHANAKQRVAMASLLSGMSPYLLPYQGRNDVQLQQIVAQITELMSVREAIVLPARRPRARLRVGMVSAYFYDHSNWKIPIQGWLHALSRQYEVYLYYTGAREDQATQEAREFATCFTDGLSVPEFEAAISNDRLDLLIYPEIGMSPATRALAALRLAPTQCVAWGHPLTSGLSVMDYFLSSEMMEGPSADECYSERLIRLPGLSFTWTPPLQLTQPEGRHQFGLSPKNVVYLCVQNLSKYLPQYDVLLLQIISRQPLAKLVFIEAAEAVSAALIGRLRAVFEGAGVDFERHVHFLPRLDRERYAALNRVADVFLDTPEWSGCNSTMEALWCDLPVVTLPGRLMRARHSSAIYQVMQYTQLIARDEAHYVALAVRLGEDYAWRGEQRARISASKYRVINDTAPSDALAERLPGLIEHAASRVNAPGA